MKPLKSIVSALVGLGIICLVAPTSAAPQIQNIDTSKAALDLMRLNNGILKSNKKGSHDLWARTRSGFQISEVNPELVRKHEQYYASRVAYFNRTLDRGGRYMHFILNEVEKRGMPTEIALLPVIESAFVTQAKSHVGASGLWQFMPATGTQYGLEQTWWYDGRRDVYESTLAALDYLEYLYRLQGDWSLALASYNWGEGRVKRATHQAQAAGLEPIYENLRMPDETRNYVPKLLAVRNIINHPESFNLELKPLANNAYFTPISINKHMDISLAAHFAEITEEEFRQLNPGFNLPVFAYKEGRQMLLPVDKVKTFKRNLSKWGNKPLMSWDIYTAQGNENLTELASNAGMSVTEFKKINGVRGSNLQAGRPVLLANNQVKELRIDNRQLLAQAATVITPSLSSKSDIILITRGDRQPTTQNTPLAVAQNTARITTLAPAPNKTTTTIAPVQSEITNTTTLVDTLPIASVTLEASPTNIAVNEPFNLAKNSQKSTLVAPDVLELFAHDLALQQDPIVKVTEVQVAALSNTTAVQTEPKLTKKATDPKAKINTDDHKVAKNETLSTIAKKYDMSLNDLMALNQLKRQTVQAGVTLKVAKQATNKGSSKNTVYVVQKGDSWYSIARKFGLNHEEIQRWNARNIPRLQPGARVNLIGL